MDKTPGLFSPAVVMPVNITGQVVGTTIMLLSQTLQKAAISAGLGTGRSARRPPVDTPGKVREQSGQPIMPVSHTQLLTFPAGEAFILGEMQLGAEPKTGIKCSE